MSENHWSNLESMKQFVNFIIVPYLHRESDMLNLYSSQNMVWLIIVGAYIPVQNFDFG